MEERLPKTEAVTFIPSTVKIKVNKTGPWAEVEGGGVGHRYKSVTSAQALETKRRTRWGVKAEQLEWTVVQGRSFQRTGDDERAEQRASHP